MKHAASNDKQECGLHPGDVFEGEVESAWVCVSAEKCCSEELRPHSPEAKEFLSILPAATVQSRLHARWPVPQSKGSQEMSRVAGSIEDLAAPTTFAPVMQLTFRAIWLATQVSSLGWLMQTVAIS